MIDWGHYRITVKPYGVSRRVRRAPQLGGTSGVGGGGGATIDLGNDSDVTDYMLLAHGGPRSNTSASVDSGGTSGHEDRRI
jgi:ribosome biogenesis protein SSF1/2